MKVFFDYWMKHRARDWLDELHLSNLNIDRVYVDTHDNLPVTVLKFHTDPKTARNEHDTMHTGALATIVDHLSTIAALADPKYWQEPEDDEGDDEPLSLEPEIVARLGHEFGVSRTIGLHVQRPTPLDADIQLEVKLLENTPSTAYLQIKARDIEGNVLFTGRHDKTKLRKVIKAKL